MPTIPERVKRIEDEISGVVSLYGVTAWETDFLRSNRARTALTPKAEEILAGIEKKVFSQKD